jgi:hypothetical protein
VWYNKGTMMKREEYQMKNYFELNKSYKFDPTDLTALIYVVATMVGINGGNTTPFFLIGSAIGTAFCWQARRINLIVLNVSLFIFNVFCAFGG